MLTHSRKFQAQGGLQRRACGARVSAKRNALCRWILSMSIYRQRWASPSTWGIICVELSIFIEKPPKPARAPSLHCPKCSDRLCLQQLSILLLKHFFKVHYETIWLWACQKFNCRFQWILSGWVAALPLEKICRQRQSSNLVVRAIPGSQASLHDLPSGKVPLSHLDPLPQSLASESTWKAIWHLRHSTKKLLMGWPGHNYSWT